MPEIVLVPTIFWVLILLVILFILVAFEWCSPKLALCLLGFGVFIGGIQFFSKPKAITPQATPLFGIPPTEKQTAKEGPTEEEVTKEQVDHTIEKTTPKSLPVTSSPASDIPSEYNVVFPPLNPNITLRIEGVNDRHFISKLEQYLGYQIKAKGNFLLKIHFKETSEQKTNRTLGKEEFNFQGGPISISINDNTCIEGGKLRIKETNYRGLKYKEAKAKLEQEKLDILQQNIQEIAKRLRQCMPK